MKEHNKRWLIGRLKTSGSKKKYVANGSYADERQPKHRQDPDDLPTHESIRKSQPIANGKLNFGPLVRFLRGQAGQHWDGVYAEIVARIPTQLLHYKEVVFDFVADKVELIDGKPFDKKKGRFIYTPEQGLKTFGFSYKEFYVHPETHILVRVADSSSNKFTDGMDKAELRTFRECEKQTRQQQKAQKKNERAIHAERSAELIKQANQKKKGPHEESEA